MDFKSFIENAALLLVMSQLSISIHSKWPEREPWNTIVLGCLYGLTAALAMNIPMALQPGVFFDGRSVILSLAGVFTSDLTTGIACLIAAAVRINLGGAGWFTGVGAIVISGLLGIIFRRFVKEKGIKLDFKSLFIFGFIVHLALTVWFFTMPYEIAISILKNVALPYLMIFPLATMMIGEFMQMEYHRLDTEKNLAASEKRYRDLVNTLNEGVWVIDQNDVTTFVNPKMAEMLGYDVNQVIGTPIYKFLLKGSRKSFKAIQERYRQGVKEQYELQLLCKGGTRLFVLVGAISLFNENNEYVGLLAGVQDITALKTTQKKLAEQSRHLEEIVDKRTHELKEAQTQLIKAEKMATLGKLAGSVGHELRNPLAVISNSTYLLKTILPNMDPQTKEYLLMIEKEIHSASQIINDLLDYSRIQPNVKEDINLSQFIRELLVRQMVPKNVKVEFDVSENLPLVKANGQQLEQIFNNLITNAVEAMPDGGVLKLSSKKSEDKLTISIVDSGVGISRRDMKRLFEPLFTTKLRGIGLGLTITGKLAELNDVKIRVKSTVGKGSTFALDFLVLT